MSSWLPKQGDSFTKESLTLYSRVVPTISIEYFCFMEATINHTPIQSTGFFKTYLLPPQSKLLELGCNLWSFQIMQLIWNRFAKKSWCESFSSPENRVFWKEVIYKGRAEIFVDTNLYNFPHREISNRVYRVTDFFWEFCCIFFVLKFVEKLPERTWGH